MAYIKYLKGDATDPIKSTDIKIIAHICNDIGRWGKGFVVPLGKKYPKAKREYLSKKRYILGDIDIIEIDNSIKIANMVAQRGIGYSKRVRVQYDDLRFCFCQLKDYIVNLKSSTSIHMPRIGCGLGGGEWSTIENIIKEELDGLDVYVYDLP